VCCNGASAAHGTPRTPPATGTLVGGGVANEAHGVPAGRPLVAAGNRTWLQGRAGRQYRAPAGRVVACPRADGAPGRPLTGNRRSQPPHIQRHACRRTHMLQTLADRLDDVDGCDAGYARGTAHVCSYLVDPASNICLSQRLSHACLSINAFIVKLQGLIKPAIVYLMDRYQGYLW
jgi:hypothetical protein